MKLWIRQPLTVVTAILGLFRCGLRWGADNTGSMDSLELWYFFLVMAALLGACVGSFLTLVTYRLPLDLPIGATRSRCPSCQKNLRARDLVPVLSWMATRGKCGQCGAKVSLRYPLTEIACAAGGVFALMHFGVSWQALAVAGLWWSIVAIIITDLEHTIILDEVQVAVALFGMVFGFSNAADGGYLDAALSMGEGALTGLGIGLALKYGFLYFRNKDGLGLGDVKFLGAAGIWLAEAPNFVPFLFFSGILGILSALVWRVFGLGEEGRFPFGPALAASLFMCVVWPGTANGFWHLYGMIH